MKKTQSPMRGMDIRKSNERLILNLILTKKRASQSEIAAWTDLKPPTVLRIFSSLEEKELIVLSKDQKETQDKKGRKPVYYSLNPRVAYTVGIEFWGASATIVLVGFTHKAVAKKTKDLEENINGEEVINILLQMTKDVLKEFHIKPEKLLGIGIGAPGQVDTKKGLVSFYSRLPGLEKINIKERFSKIYSCPIIMSNNCSVITMHEYAQGTAKDSHALLSILIRSGVGGAFLNDGKLLISCNKTTLELGHMSVDFNGRTCDCGEKGCLEAYISEPVLKKDLSKYFIMNDITDIDVPIIEKNGEVLEILKEKALILSNSIRNIYHLLNPDTVLIISRSSGLAEFLADEVHNYLKRNRITRNDEGINVIPLTYSPERAGLGAADLVFQHYFSAH